MLIGFSPLKPEGLPSLPLLAALYLSELGTIITLFGAWLSGRDAYHGIRKNRNAMICMGNLLLSVNLFVTGVKVWPDSF